MSDWVKAGAVAAVIGVPITIIGIVVAHLDARDPAQASPAAPGVSGAPNTAVSTPSTGSPGPIVARHHDDRLTVPNDESVDLDAPPEDRLWRRTTSGDYDLSYYAGGIATGTSSILVLGATPATYENCQASGYASGAFLTESTLPTRAYFCVQTSEHRFVAAEVLQRSDDRVVLDVTSYDPPSSG